MLFFISLIVAFMAFGILMCIYIGMYESLEDAHGFKPEKAGFFAAVTVAVVVSLIVGIVSCNYISKKMIGKDTVETMNNAIIQYDEKAGDNNE